MGVSASIDLSKLEKRFSNEALRKKQAAFAHRVGFDMNKHCPVDEGTLRDSMPAASNFEAGQVIWDTPYAKEVMERDHVRTKKNPKALPHWPEATKAERLEAWRVAAANLLDGSDADVEVLT